MALQFRPAVREAVPMPIAISGPSGSGKTFSALLVAAGIAGTTGKVALLDSENGRGKLYADSPGIKKALPNGYLYAELPSPFSPQSYIQAIDDAEAAGITVLVIDSGSHEWEGPGGCEEIADKAPKKWATAKKEHKKFVYRLLYSHMHIILCLRAREKIKIVGKEHIPLGILPICEKNFMFEMLLSLQLEDKTHHAIPVKVPEALQSVFPGGRMLSKEDGERVRRWIDSGSIADSDDRLKKRARLVAEEGMKAYTDFFSALTPVQKKMLVASTHAENKAIAEQADKDGEAVEVEKLPDPVELVAGTVMRCGGSTWVVTDTPDGYQWVEAQAAA